MITKTIGRLLLIALVGSTGCQPTPPTPIPATGESSVAPTPIPATGELSVAPTPIPATGESSVAPTRPVSGDPALTAQLVTKLQTLRASPLAEKISLSAITQEHAQQIADNPQDTAFKTQATYQPVPPSALMMRILQSGVFPSHNLFNTFFSANSETDALNTLVRLVQRNMGSSPFTHYGIGVAKTSQQWFISLVLMTEVVTLQGIADRLENTGVRQIQGAVVTPGYTNPSALVTLPSGQVEEVALTVNGSQFSLNYDFSQTGHYSFEINVIGPFGPEPATNFGVAVGVSQLIPRVPSSSAAPEMTDLEQSRRELLALINQDRQEHGVASIEIEPILNQAAQKHSADMIANGFVGHNSPTNGTPQQQANKVGISELVGQNIATSRSLLQAQADLMSSPGHRKIIIDPRLTHVGLGIQRGDDGFLYVTQDFITRRFELERLPDIASGGITIHVKGKALKREGFVIVFMNGQSVIQNPLNLADNDTFSVPVTLPTTGTTAKIQVGYSDGADTSGTFTFKFSNVWEIKIQ